MEIDLENITKEESLNIINTLINKSGITKKEVNESYNSSTITNKDKKNVVRIRLMSQNEAILKLMVPYGNKQNLHGTYSYPYPDQRSEGKYAITHCSRGVCQVSSVYFPVDNRNKIDDTKFNNLYEYSYGGQNTIGFLSQNSGTIGYANRSNGYGMLYQDNYEDKPEIRVNTKYYVYTFDSYGPSNNQLMTYTQYSKNGHAETSTAYTTNDWGGGYTFRYHAVTVNIGVVTTYKTSTENYQGMWPVLAVAS